MNVLPLKILATFLCAMPGLCFAVAETVLDEIVVTSTRSAQPLNLSLSSTSVITRQEVLNSQCADVPSLLQNVAGIEFYQSGGIGKQSSLFMRGSNSNQVLVLLDGMRINSATTGSTAIDQLMLDQIERIEIVRGNVSSLYGSDAIGGVIQIFTKHEKGPPAFNVSAALGTHNTQRVSTGLGGEVGSNDFNLQVSKFKTDSVSAINSVLVPTVNPDKDGYDNSSVSANLRHLFSLNHSLSGSFFKSLGKVQFDDAYAQQTDLNSSTSTLSKFALVSENLFNEGWQSTLLYGQGTDELKTRLNGFPDPSGAYVQTQTRQLNWQNNVTLNANGNALVGAEKLHQKVSSDIVYSQSGRNINSLFGGYTGAFGVHRVQLNLRQDRYSDFGATHTGLAGYGFTINPAWRITVNASSGFKAPTFTDLYGPAAWGSNPSLKPERSHNKEFGMHYFKTGHYLDIVYFDNRMNDLIAADNTFTLQNLKSARNNGQEFSYAGQFGDTAVKAALTLQNPQDTTTGLALLRRAKSFGNVGVAQKKGAWQVGGEVQYSGERADYDINTFMRTTLGSYALVNLTTAYMIDKNLNVSMRANNLFNRDYMLAHGYNAWGRTLFVGMSYRQ